MNRRAATTKLALREYRQVRVVVPYSDFKLYQVAKKFGHNYRQFLVNSGRKFFKRMGKGPGWRNDVV